MAGPGYSLSPLMSAVHAGDEVGVRQLLSTGANPNEEGWVPDGGTHYTMPALFCAAWRGHTAIVKLLLQYGANANASHRFGREDDDSPLRYALGAALDARDPEMVGMLLDAGATVAHEPVAYLGGPLSALEYAMERAYDARVIEMLRRREKGGAS